MDLCFDDIMTIDYVKQLKNQGLNYKNTGVIYIYNLPVKSDLSTHIVNLIEHYTPCDRRYSIVDQKTFTLEMWVEVLDRKMAKAFVTKKNGTELKGLKGTYYQWNLKYLTGFKWTDLLTIKEHLISTEENAKQEELIKAKHTAAEFCANVFGVDANELADYDQYMEAVPEGQVNVANRSSGIANKREDFFNNLFS